MPKAPLGWTKATVVPRDPGRGASSMTWPPWSLTDWRALGAVVHPVADVVEALALLLQVLGDRRVVADRGQQLDVAVRHLEERLLHAVGLDPLAVGDGGPEGLRVVGDGRLEVPTAMATWSISVSSGAVTRRASGTG